MRISDWSSDVCSSDLLLKARSIVLQEVTIRGMRNYTQDSLNFRKEFASVFGYNAPRFKDIFVNNSPNAHPYSSFQNSTSTLASINLQFGRASCRERVCQYV